MGRILVVEDYEPTRRLLVRWLERDKHQVLVAEDGATAIQLAHHELPDLILMDLNLPIMDGWEAIRQIRAHAPSARIPIISMTAGDVKTAASTSGAAGTTVFVAKPVDFVLLRSHISSLLQSS
jgi:CheY-like chemotaxis protein